MSQNLVKRAAQVHGVTTPREYKKAHQVALARKRLRGIEVLEHVVETPVFARIDAGRWLIDCECNAGNAVDPDWPEARCFACGAVHTAIVFPADIPALEHALVEAAVREQFWRPGELVKVVEDRIVDRVGGLGDKEQE